jgi:molybdopterin-guanine dinucleotide biosynthesis protein B
MKVVGLAGWSGAGKTTLLTRVLPLLTARGLKVSTLKHAHHAFDIDHPGKDSFEHRAAGAGEVLIVSGRRWALLHELRGEAEPRLAELLGKLAPCDLVIVEGFKRAVHPKVEISRAANGKPFLYPEMTDVRGLICDLPPTGWAGPLVHPDEIEAAAALLLAAAAPLAAVQDALRADRPLAHEAPPQPVG